jgi:hypothetical protein
MRTAARVARIALWIMIAAIVFSFFMKSKWITTVWIVAAVVCLVCTLIVAVSQPGGGRR